MEKTEPGKKIKNIGIKIDKKRLVPKNRQNLLLFLYKMLFYNSQITDLERLLNNTKKRQNLFAIFVQLVILQLTNDRFRNTAKNPYNLEP